MDLSRLPARKGPNMISPETREVERHFDLMDRLRAVQTCIHARDYLANSVPWLTNVPVMHAVSLLGDGIINAIDGRSTGREFRTVRFRYGTNDPGQPVAEQDRRCQSCGAVDYESFSHCWQHRPERMAPPAPVAEPEIVGRVPSPLKTLYASEEFMTAWAEADVLLWRTVWLDGSEGHATGPMSKSNAEISVGFFNAEHNPRVQFSLDGGKTWQDADTKR